MITEGQVLDGTYRLHRLIAEGGMGVVYEASHARLAGRYAIKVLLQNLAENPELRVRFDCEARITSMLQHPNVVQVIDHNTTADGTAYLVMEYLDGESLAQRKQRLGRLPPADVADIIDQVAAGLAAAHAHGIVHRDLKPDNIVLVPVEGHGRELAKVLDFGISKADWSGQAPEHELCGTPQYMAPEQVEGRLVEVEAATDQFALAVVAYELLTGTNPFMDRNVGAIFARVAKAAPPPAGVNAAVDAVLARALAKPIRRRFPSMRAFADALKAAVNALPREVPATFPAGELSAPPRGPRPATRRRWLTLGLGFTACAATLLFFSGDARPRLRLPGPRAALPVVPVTAASPAVRDPRPAVADAPPAPEPSDAEPTEPEPKSLPTAPAPALERAHARPRHAPRPRPRALPALSPDEDATLPLSEALTR